MNLEITFAIPILILFICYTAIHILALKGISKLQKGNNSEQHRFSIIVAARNEERHIGNCLQSLVKLHYPKESYEIIVVNDRSTDTTAKIVREYQKKFSMIRLLTIEEITSGLPGKKNALNEGINASTYDILALTDADCTVPPEWLTILSLYFEPAVGVVAGYSPFEEHFAKTLSAKIGQSFLHYEEMKNSFGTAAGIGLRNAYMCTGRNFAYRKEVFQQVGGFEKIKHSISGDDDLLIQLIQSETQWEIRYMAEPEGFVTTQPPLTFAEFINQRKRHFSASKFYPLRMKTIFALVHAFNGMVMISFFFSPVFAGMLTAGKFIVDGIAFRTTTRVFGNSELFPWCIPLEICFIFYNLIVGPLGLIGTFNWKSAHE
ncbi:MAG: glycosyltransferase [Bacteroidota bacterium]|nr:glycosyltransferase [Bacteroidota bacterium]